MLAAIRTKKGYYIRRVKDGLWATFGINRIKPFKDNYTTQQIKEWKQSKNAQSVYNDLYISSNPEDDEADTYLTLIIKYVFTAEKERTSSNGLWVQSILESIFDKTHLSTKIESEIIDTWIDVITDTEMVNITKFYIAFTKLITKFCAFTKLITNIKYLYIRSRMKITIHQHTHQIHLNLLIIHLMTKI